jgi:uncharacterized repeat protein (TIGR03803 family)
VFTLDPTDGVETVLYSFCSRRHCRDGDGPYWGVIGLNDKLYGTTRQGGAYGYGTVFSLNGGKEKVLHSFGSGNDGEDPVGDLIKVD